MYSIASSVVNTSRSASILVFPVSLQIQEIISSLLFAKNFLNKINSLDLSLSDLAAQITCACFAKRIFSSTISAVYNGNSPILVKVAGFRISKLANFGFCFTATFSVLSFDTDFKELFLFFVSFCAITNCSCYDYFVFQSKIFSPTGNFWDYFRNVFIHSHDFHWYII